MINEKRYPGAHPPRSDAMLTIWGRKNSINVQKVLWTAAELGLAYEHRPIGGASGSLDVPEYLRLNPNRLIPTIEDGGVVVWESNACVRYLAAQYGRGGLWAEDAGERAAADMWMDWMTGNLAAPLSPVFVGLIRTPPEKRDPAAIAAGIEKLGRLFGILDRHLAQRAFVAGARFSMGDIPVGAACYRYFELPIERPALPHLSGWYERLQQRAAYRTHVMLPLT
jgi:glutathione S-transferase